MSIAENRRARHEYNLEEHFEAGIVLEGWEIKAIRSGQVQLTEGYVVIRNGELNLIGCRIDPLRSASTHVSPIADRTRKLLLHKEQIRRLVGKVEQRGYTIVPLNLHYKAGIREGRDRAGKGPCRAREARGGEEARLGAREGSLDAAQGLVEAKGLIAGTTRRPTLCAWSLLNQSIV